MQKEQHHQSTTLLNHSKDSQNLNTPIYPGEKDSFDLFYDKDTGHVFVERSPQNRKAEINSFGLFVKSFNSLAEAQYVKAMIDRFPYLAAKILNIPLSWMAG